MPARTALGAMAIGFYLVLTLSGGNDVIADKFNISLNAMTWAGRIGILIIPPLAYYIAYRIALGLQQHDREVLAHGVETGIIKRLPTASSSRSTSRWQPPTNTATPHCPTAAGSVPKKMNRIGAIGPAVKGFFVAVEKPAPTPRGAGVTGTGPRGDRQRPLLSRTSRSAHPPHSAGASVG